MASQQETERRARLLQEYAVAAEHYAWAVGELNRQRATASEQHYKDLYRIVELARKDCERLRKELSKFRV
jgi:hypothetical protein